VLRYRNQFCFGPLALSFSMDSLSPNVFRSRAVRLSQIASGAVALAGSIALVGWLLDAQGLKSVFLPGPTLKTNASIALICSALANLVLVSTDGASRWLLAVRLLAVVPVTLGGLTLSEHVVGWNLGIDQLIAMEAPGAFATTSPNRMGPPASIANLLLGLAVLCGTTKSNKLRILSDAFTSITSVIVLLPLIGYAYGVSNLYAIARYTGIALVNAAALLALAVGIQAGRPDGVLAAFLCRRDEVGVFARRLLPAALLGPFCCGWLLARLFQADVVDTGFALSAMTIVLTVTFAILIRRTGGELSRLLMARERAEQSVRESDQQKTEFLATLSHELRNPLAPIRFAVELLNGTPTSAERARKTIERQVHHLTRLIDDLLDLTRITRNKLELRRHSVEFGALIQEAVDSVASDVARAEHELEILMPEYPVWLHADRDRVVQMLVNLLSNAIRYSAPRKKIVVGAHVEQTDVTIFVRDRGHGIDPADLERVFERFVQVGASHHSGLGIGLALVKALAHLHGGSVEARSEGLGHGSEFRLRLPRSDAPARLNAVEHARERACRILVVDDNRDAADMLTSLLTARGHNVRVAYDGEDALREARVFKPEVALLDIGMAGMNGYEVATRLRADSKLSGLFLVAITGWGQKEDRKLAFSAGFDTHLTKPADPDTVTALLATRFPLLEA
jgi:YD repeat-containing protein